MDLPFDVSNRQFRPPGRDGIWGMPPMSRQFISKPFRWRKAHLARRLGFARVRETMAKFSIVTFGCQMNEHDSSRMAEILISAGHQETAAVDTAQIVVLNTCSVREKAAQKLRSEVGRLAARKQEQRDLVIVVAGCLGQQEGARLLKSAPEIDLVIGPDNLAELPGLLVDLDMGGPRRSVAEFDLDAPRFLAADPTQRRIPPATYVTVMKGCDERCTFCIVPYTRGSERYRASGEIVDEIRRLVAAGVR
ncbi:MAG TPA: hypothetical protein VIV60_04415, partial [Polyangiaceae bacterium]